MGSFVLPRQKTSIMCLFSCAYRQRLSAKTLLVRTKDQVITRSGTYRLYLYYTVFPVSYSVRSPFISGGVCYAATTS